MLKLGGTKALTLMGMFTAIIFLMAFTPVGFIQLPFIKATLVHIPVIIGALLLGPRYGAVLGFFFGLTSLINNTLAPAVLSFVFSPFVPLPLGERGVLQTLATLAVCFVPRVLVGVAPYYVFVLIKKAFRKGGHASDTFCYAVAGVAGSLTNTLLVMHLIFLFFTDDFAATRENLASGAPLDAVYAVILGIIAANGVPEAIVAAVLVAAVCVAVSIPLKSPR
jgi:uncharacterized membrane protein